MGTGARSARKTFRIAFDAHHDVDRRAFELLVRGFVLGGDVQHAQQIRARGVYPMNGVRAIEASILRKLKAIGDVRFDGDAVRATLGAAPPESGVCALLLSHDEHAALVAYLRLAPWNIRIVDDAEALIQRVERA